MRPKACEFMQLDTRGTNTCSEFCVRRAMIKRLILIQIFTCLAIGHAQVTPAKMNSTTKPSSQLEGFKTYEKPASTTPPAKPELPPAVKPLPQVPQHAEYLHPGILVYLNGNWEGSDHLLNISKNIGVYVRIIKPEEEALDINQKELQNQVETAFGEANIKALTMAAVGKPPLPAFEIEIFVYPIEKGYAAFIDGRLFESVVLDRFKMDPNMAFQAITWEKQTLIVGPKESFAELLSKSVQDVSAAFIARYLTYEQIKNSGAY